MANQAMQNEVDEYIEQFISASKNNGRMRRQGGGNIHNMPKRKCGTRATRGAKVVNAYTLDELYKRHYGEQARAIA